MGIGVVLWIVNTLSSALSFAKTAVMSIRADTVVDCRGGVASHANKDYPFIPYAVSFTVSNQC